MTRSGVTGLALLALAPLPAVACPVCDAPTGARVRAEIVGPDFGINLLGLLLPFAVLMGFVLLVGRSPRKHSPPAEARS